jgi:hypothetical protein
MPPEVLPSRRSGQRSCRVMLLATNYQRLRRLRVLDVEEEGGESAHLRALHLVVHLAEGADGVVEGVADAGAEAASGNVPRATRRATSVIVVCFETAY